MSKPDIMRILTVNAQSKRYEISIGTQWIDQAFIQNLSKNKRLVVITDENLFKIYGTLLEGLDVFVIEAGEVSKCMEVYSEIQKYLIEKNLTRSDSIVAFGGGVVGDLAGFVAATYMRGIGFVQIPTTLLAMVDSSVGGKVAINHGTGKNIIGSFYQPDAVYMDTALLDTLPEEEFSCGMAEVIKYGLIWDALLFDKLRNPKLVKEHIVDVISRCCEIKAEIVSRDEEDRDLRQILNFGHTLGHAIESYYHYRDYKHGQGVAIGMAVKSKMALETGKITKTEYEDIIKVLKLYNLPLEVVKAEDWNAIIKDMIYDKKAEGSRFKLIQLDAVGNVKIEAYDFETLIKMFQI